MTRATTVSEDDLHVLVLAGGRGTRFWPLSREQKPKQLIPMLGETSLLRATAERLAPTVKEERVWVCTTSELAPAVREQMPRLASGEVDRLLEEPCGRDTAPAIAWAVWQMRHHAQTIAVLPSDHWITRPGDFREALQLAADASCERQEIVTLGVRPDRPETGFGYLEIEAPGGNSPLGALEGVLSVRRFVEKPTLERAQEFLLAGNYLWNAGMFVFSTEVFLRELESRLPEIAEQLPALQRAARSGDSATVDRLYRALPRTSIDFGLMEKVEEISAVPLDCGWSDLGSFEALAELLPGDSAGNHSRGDVVVVDSSQNILVAEEGTIAALGVDGLVVVRVEDCVLVMPRERAQDVRQVVAALRERGSERLL